MIHLPWARHGFQVERVLIPGKERACVCEETGPTFEPSESRTGTLRSRWRWAGHHAAFSCGCWFLGSPICLISLRGFVIQHMQLDTAHHVQGQRTATCLHATYRACSPQTGHRCLLHTMRLCTYCASVSVVFHVPKRDRRRKQKRGAASVGTKQSVPTPLPCLGNWNGL